MSGGTQKGGSNYPLHYLRCKMKSCPAIHQHTRPHPKRGVYLPYFPTFQKLPHLQRKKNKKLSQLNLPFFVLLTPFTDGPFESQKTARDPWGMRNRKMQCHLRHGRLQRNRSLERGCAINRMFALRQPSQMLWSTVPRES